MEKRLEIRNRSQKYDINYVGLDIATDILNTKCVSV